MCPAPRLRHAVTALSAALVSTPLCGVAQEALRSALEEDRAAQTRQADFAVPPGQLRAGPVALTAALSYQFEVNDNRDYSERNRQPDVIQGPQLGFQAFWPMTKTSRLTFGAGIGYANYVLRPKNDRFTITPDSELALDLPVRDVVLSFYDRFHYAHDVVSQAALSGVSELPRFENTIGARVIWQPKQWLLLASYEHFTLIATDDRFTYLDRSSEQFFGRVGYRFARATQAGWEASGTLTDYDSFTQVDNNSISLGPFVDWKVRKSVEVSLRGGYVYYRFLPNDIVPINQIVPSGAGDQTLHSYYVSAEVKHQLTDFFWHTLLVSHDIRPGVNQGGLYNEMTSIQYGINWTLRRPTILSANFFYERGKEALGGGNFTDDFNRFGANTSISQQLTRKLSARLTYRFVDKESKFQLRSYQQNYVALSAHYQF
jgi:hypothetical protein